MRSIKKWLTLCAVVGAIAIGHSAAAADSTAQDALAKDKVCTKCHDESDNKPILSIYQTRHGVKADARTPGCQTCHGPSDLHVRNPQGTKERPAPDVAFGSRSKTPLDEKNGTCLACHQAEARAFWTGSAHQTRDLACANCHTVHAPRDAVLAKLTQAEVCETCHKTQRAQTHLFSRHPILEGKVACSDCHAPHGSTGPKLLVKSSVNETCYTCHAEKRGPFLWEHGPVVDDCTNCHTPHGSNNAPLLKVRVPWLCQACHSGDHGAAINSGANLPRGNATTVNGLQPLGNQSPRAQTNARACLNCHVLVHGSNHPAGTKFQR